MDTGLDRPRRGSGDRSAGHRDADVLTLSEPAVSDRQQRRILLPVLTVVFLAALDLTVVAPILPSVLRDLQINPVDADRYSWIVLSYLVAYTVTVPITGRISDF